MSLVEYGVDLCRCRTGQPNGHNAAGNPVATRTDACRVTATQKPDWQYDLIFGALGIIRLRPEKPTGPINTQRQSRSASREVDVPASWREPSTLQNTTIAPTRLSSL